MIHKCLTCVHVWWKLEGLKKEPLKVWLVGQPLVWGMRIMHVRHPSRCILQGSHRSHHHLHSHSQLLSFHSGENNPQNVHSKTPKWIGKSCRVTLKCFQLNKKNNTTKLRSQNQLVYMGHWKTYLASLLHRLVCTWLHRHRHMWEPTLKVLSLVGTPEPPHCETSNNQYCPCLRCGGQWSLRFVGKRPVGPVLSIQKTFALC